MKHRTIRRSLQALGILAAAAILATPAMAAGTPAGTDITNQATVDYEDANGNPLSAVSNIVTTTVSQVAAVVVSPDNASNADPGDTVTYAHTLQNNGNAADTFDLTAVSSNGWTTVVFVDNNANNQYDAGTDTVITDSGAVAADGTFDFWVAVTVPAGTADGALDVTTVTATSQFDTNVSDTATDTTTVSSPALTVTKSVSPSGPQPPGTTLTYTIVVNNGGSIAAANVVLTDPVPANTTYVAGSITQDGAGRTDAADGDNADHDVTNPGEITVDVGALASGASTTVTFQVTIN